MILANKCDMNDRRQVSLERGAAVSDRYNTVCVATADVYH